MKIIKPSFVLSSAALLLWPLAAPGLLSPPVAASEVQGVRGAVVGASHHARPKQNVAENAEGFGVDKLEESSEEFSEDMLEFILSFDAEILQAIEHRPLLDMLDDDAGNKTDDRVSRANGAKNGAKAVGRYYE